MKKNKASLHNTNKKHQYKQSNQHNSDTNEVDLKWPKLSRKSNLSMRRYADSFKLFTVDNYFTQHECQQLIDFAERITFTPTEKGPPKRGYAFRDNDRISIQDAQFAQHIWESGLSDLFHSTDGGIAGGADKMVPVGCNSNIRLYRYSVGQQFGAHIDESVQLDGGRRHTRHTVLIYLSGGSTTTAKSPIQLKGGELIFYKGKGKVFASIEPVAGLLVVHEHGDHCLEHEAAAVTRGVKYVLRTDVVWANEN